MIDPLTASTSLATIVGLICNFKQERKDGRDAKHQEFMEWLEYHRHEDLKNQIANNYHLMAEVDGLLKQDTETILARLGAIDDVLARILSHVEGFAGVARIIKPGIELSDQAIHILRGLVRSDSDKFGLIRQLGGPTFLSLTRGGGIDIHDPRFLEADLDLLVNMGLLRLEYGGSGTQFFGITREAVKLVDLVDQSQR